MKLGWMRADGTGIPALSWSDQADIIAHADSAGFHQIHLPHLCLNAAYRLPHTRRMQVAIHIEDLLTFSPRLIADKLRAAMDVRQNRLVLSLSSGRSARARTTRQIIETLISADQDQGHGSIQLAGLCPEVLSVPPCGEDTALRHAAADGFHALTPAWRARKDLAGDWTDIMIGATHARRRARPAEWHLARHIYVHDDPAQIAAYRATLADNHTAYGFRTREDALREVIAGPAAQVIDDIAHLRDMAGPFGVLHCVDPGLAAGQGRRLRDRLTSEILPALTGQAETKEKVLETS